MSEPPCGHKFNRRTLLGSSAAIGAALLTSGRHPVSSAMPSSPARTSTASFQEPKELTIAATDEDIARIQPLLEEYARANRITIKTEPNPYPNLYAKLSINLTQSTGAYDIVSLDDPWMPLFAGGEFLKNLDEMMDNAGMAPDSDFVPRLMALGAFPPDSGLRAIPWVGNVQLFAWRADLLHEMDVPVPRTWDDVLAAATEITTAKRNQDLFGIGLRGQPGNPAATSFLPVLRGFGKEILDPETSEPQLDTPPARDAFALHLKLAAQAPDEVEHTGHGENGANLASGRIAMSADIWPDQLLQALDHGTESVADAIAVGPQPNQPGIHSAHVTGNWLLGIPSSSRNAELALDLILWLTSADQQRRLLVERNVPPTRASILGDPDLTAAVPFLPSLLEAARSSQPRPRTPHFPAIEEILGRYLTDAITSSMAGAEAARRANEEIRALLVREGVLE